MELRLLNYFYTIAETGSVSRAAEILHITQPTLSRQLKELEEELGTPLFTRDKRQMKLTEAGLFLKSRAAEILSLTTKTTQEFADRRAQLFSGQFSIGCVEADNSDTLALMLEEFVADYPQVHFHIHSGTGDDITDRLEKGLLDLAIILEPIDTQKYEKIILPRKERWGVLVASDTELGERKTLTATDVKNLPLLVSRRLEVQTLLATWLDQSAEELNIVGTYNLIFNIFALVENHVGNAFTIEGSVSNRRQDTLRFIPLEPEMTTNCVLVWKKNRVISPVVTELIARFRKSFGN